ncbi:MAG: ATP-grasp domain-containing protein, partial [archaeon]
MKVAILYSEVKELKTGLPDELQAERDVINTVTAIQSALVRQGHEASKVKYTHNVIEELKEGEYNVVFNLCDSFEEDTSLEPHIPAALALVGIPCTGCSSRCLNLTLDKAVFKNVLAHHDIGVPKLQIFEDAEAKFKLDFPAIVKPLHEGASIGIRNENLVKNEEQLRERINFILKTYDQPAIVEEFLPGTEYSVPIIGPTNDPVVLPIVEKDFGHLPPGANPIMSFEAKWQWSITNPDGSDPSFKIAQNLDPSLEAKLIEMCKKSYKLLDCSGYCRFDIRLDAQGEPKIIDVNSNPGIDPSYEVGMAAKHVGIGFDELVMRIVDCAVKEKVQRDVPAQLEFKIVSDLTECEALWKKYSTDEHMFDLWEYRACLYDPNFFVPHFIIGYKEGEEIGILPLWNNKLTKDYTFFGEYFPERNKILMKDKKYFLD